MDEGQDSELHLTVSCPASAVVFGAPGGLEKPDSCSGATHCLFHNGFGVLYVIKSICTEPELEFL